MTHLQLLFGNQQVSQKPKYQNKVTQKAGWKTKPEGRGQLMPGTNK